MNIALIGYGKMGRTIERIATERGHNILLKIGRSNIGELTRENLRQADIAIEFTAPEAARENVLKCIDAGVNVISGTTGWNKSIDDAEHAAAASNVGFLHASNFSIGVNIFFQVNKLLASLMKEREEYGIAIEETHHTQKKDLPSGTAITLAEQIISNMERKKRWVVNDYNEDNAIPIIAYRVEDVPGTHKIAYSSKVDDIEIKHIAHNRDGFAFGAVLAAEFIRGKKGVFTMKDVLFGRG